MLSLPKKIVEIEVIIISIDFQINYNYYKIQ